MSSTQLNIDGQYVVIPDKFEEVLSVSLSANDYALSGARLIKGFLFKSDTAGSFSVITLKEFNAKGGVEYLAKAPPTNSQRNTILRSCDKDKIFLGQNEWISTPVVFVDRSGAASLNINVGLY